MLRKMLRKMVENGDTCTEDLGKDRAMKAEEKIFRQAEELEATEESFDRQMTALEKKFETKVLKRREVQDAGRTEEATQELEGDRCGRRDSGGGRDALPRT